MVPSDNYIIDIGPLIKRLMNYAHTKIFYRVSNEADREFKFAILRIHNGIAVHREIDKIISTYNNKTITAHIDVYSLYQYIYIHPRDVRYDNKDYPFFGYMNHIWKENSIEQYKLPNENRRIIETFELLNTVFLKDLSYIMLDYILYTNET